MPQLIEMDGTANMSSASVKFCNADFNSACAVSLPSLSVIVLNYKAEELTTRCLWSVAESDYRGPLEIILVDNGATASSIVVLKALAQALPCPVSVVHCERNLGFTGGVLAAWPHANGELICLLNNDALVHPRCLTTLAEKLKDHTDIGAVWPYDAPLCWHTELKVPQSSEVALMRNGTHSVTGANMWLPLLRDYRQCFTGSGVCMVFAKRTVEYPFPEEYFAYFEDVFLGWTLQLKGLRVERVPEAVIYHAGSATASKHPRLRPLLAFHAEKNRLANLFVFYNWFTLLRLMPLLLVAELANLAGSLVPLLRSEPTSARIKAHIASRMWLIGHIGWLLRLRKQLQQVRKVQDHRIISLLSARLTMQDGRLGKLLNSFSLTYCRLVGIRTVELISQT